MKHMRLRRRIKIIWLLICNSFTQSDREQKWWLWSNEKIEIIFKGE